MSAMNRYSYCNILGVILSLQFYTIQGAGYTLSGSPSFGIRGEYYRFKCEISTVKIPTDVVFTTNRTSVCKVTLCQQASSTGARYTCGCISGNNRTLYLDITNVQSVDAAGEWTCGDGDLAGVSSQPVALPVYYGPENIGFTPTSSSITVIENESRTVTCSADCKPPCNINWYRDSTIISSTELLPLNNFTRQQAGNYICKITNTQISGSLQSKQLMVIVYYGPENIRFTPTGSSITVVENESTTATCSADCNPPCNINWYKDSTMISSSELLPLNNTQRQQAGNYACQVTNTQIPDSMQSKQLMVIVHYTDVNECNNMLGVGIAVGLGISILMVCIAVALAWVILKRNGKRVCIKSVQANDQTVINGTTNQGFFSGTPQVVTNTRDVVNLDHINASRTSSTYDHPNAEDYLTPVNTYEELDKQTMDHQPNNYQDLSAYQNVTGMGGK